MTRKSRVFLSWVVQTCQNHANWVFHDVPMIKKIYFIKKIKKIKKIFLKNKKI